MRRISFAQTIPQIRDQSKTVTRRLGWRELQAGTFLLAVDKGRGLKKGQKPEILGVIEVIKAETIPLSSITKEDCVREGFPDLSPSQFIAMFIDRLGSSPECEVRRIEFKYRNDLMPACSLAFLGRHA